MQPPAPVIPGSCAALPPGGKLKGMPNSESPRFRRFLADAEEYGASSKFASVAAGQRVLVTGAGGYIGSALATAIASGGAALIVLLDSCEQNLSRLQKRLEAAQGSGLAQAVVGSVADVALLNGLFERFHPTIVYHAAALKHVAPLESDPVAAVHNNALGTYALAQAAQQHGASTLVLVSTDKAVNPHSIMGASKRLAEFTVAALSSPQCQMNAVRLGNVIGSSGSVIPIFREQISRGGPVTVTHPDVSRYFLSLHEAAEAILAGGAAECGGRILLPHLGEPEPIAAIAQFLISKATNGSAGRIAVQFIGLRPGEKLAEDLILATEVREGTVAGQLDVIATPLPAAAELQAGIEQLACHAARGDVAGLVGTICAMVPEYRPSCTILAAMRPGGSAGR